MKRFKMLSALALGCLLAGSLCVLTGCGPKEDEPGDPDAAVLNFVATDGTNWDASVTIAQKTYNLSMDLNADKTLELVGTCTGEAQQGGSGGGTVDQAYAADLGTLAGLTMTGVWNQTLERIEF